MSTDFNLDSRLHSDPDVVDMFPTLSARQQNKFQEKKKKQTKGEHLWKCDPVRRAPDVNLTLAYCFPFSTFIPSWKASASILCVFWLSPWHRWSHYLKNSSLLSTGRLSGRCHNRQVDQLMTLCVWTLTQQQNVEQLRCWGRNHKILFFMLL